MRGMLGTLGGRIISILNKWISILSSRGKVPSRSKTMLLEYPKHASEGMKFASMRLVYGIQIVTCGYATESMVFGCKVYEMDKHKYCANNIISTSYTRCTSQVFHLLFISWALHLHRFRWASVVGTPRQGTPRQLNQGHCKHHGWIHATVL